MKKTSSHSHIFDRSNRRLRAASAMILAGMVGLSFLPASVTPSDPSTRTLAATPAASQATPSLQGDKAIEHLKQQGTYDSLQEAMAAARYEARWQPLPQLAGIAASNEFTNRANNLLAYMTGEGMDVTSLEGETKNWRMGLKLTGYGYGDDISAVALGEITAKGNRVSIHKSAIRNPQSAIEEWFVNDDRGIEHGFTIPSRPESAIRNPQSAIGDPPLQLRFAVTGDLHASIDGSGTGAVFSRESDSVLVTYNKLLAVDAKGRALEARMKLEEGGLAIEVEDSGAEYPLTIDPLLAEQQKLTADNGVADDHFGFSVAISGDTAVVGANQDNAPISNQGSAVVFVRSGTAWTQQQRLTASDGAADDQFGTSVSISEDTVIVGASRDDVGAHGGQGSAYVYVRSGTTWTEQAHLTASDGAANDDFGVSVGISGDRVVVGAEGDDAFTGSAYAFVRSGTVWTEQAKLTASDATAGDAFGLSAAISGNTIVVGAFFNTIGAETQQGAAYVFARNGSNWPQQQKLTASDGLAHDWFGISVSIDQNTIVVGASLDDAGGNASQGSAYVFVRSAGNWTQEQKLTANDGAANDKFGTSVAISGDTVVVGASADDVGPDNDQGSAYAFVRSGTSWTQKQRLRGSDGAADDFFGISVGVSGDSVVVGAYLDDVGAKVDQGSAYVFVCTWSEQFHAIPSGPAAGQQFGTSVAVSGDTVVVGAPINRSAYVYVRSGTSWTEQQNLTATGGMAGDRFGISVAISGNRIVIGAHLDDSAGADQGSAYVFVRSGMTWTQQQKLMASDGAPGDQFGQSVSISENTLVVGAAFDDSPTNNEGSAYVFTRSGTTWTQQQKLTASDAGTSDLFGISVAISGVTVVIGSIQDVGGTSNQGSAYIFVRSGTTWTEQQKITASDGGADDLFGMSVAISGDTVVVGAYADDVGANATQGSAYVFVRIGTVWTEQQKLTASDGAVGDEFGRSVAISGDTVVAGASLDDVIGADQGSAYVFVRSGATWTEHQKLTASDGLGADQFGGSVSVSGNTIVVGAAHDFVGGFSDQGSAYMFFMECNTAPVIVASGTITLQQSSTPTAVTIATVSDSEDPIGNLTVSVVTFPPDISFVSSIINTNGVITTSIFSNCNAAIGIHIVMLQVQDSNGAIGTAQLLIDVTANTPPTLGVYADTAVAVTGSTTVVPSLPPMDNGSYLFLSVSSPTFTGTLVIVNSSNGNVFVSNAKPAGMHVVTVTADDTCFDPVVETSFVLTVTCQSITVNPSTIPDGTAGTFYTQTFGQTGANPPFTASLTGTLPGGMTFNPATGTLSGTPTQTGSFPITATATDTNGCTGSRDYTLVIGAPSAVTLISFDAKGYDNGAFIEWQTGLEADNLGFNIYRDEGGKRTLVNQQLVAGSAMRDGSGLQAGESYAWWDQGIADCGSRIADCKNVVYWLEDVDLKGSSTWHGPFASKHAGGTPSARSNATLISKLGSNFSQELSTRVVEAVASLAPGSSAEKSIQSSLVAHAAVKIAVRREGWYRVTQPELVAAGLNLRIDPRFLQLFVDGRELPIHVTTGKGGAFDQSSAIEFYGVGLDTPSTDSRIYWLTTGDREGKRIAQTKALGAASSAQSFTQTVERRDRTIYFSALLNGEKENFFGAVIAGAGVDQTLTLTHLAEFDTSNFETTLEVVLQGVTLTAHRVLVELNGVGVREISFNGQAQGVSKFSLNHSLLREGENTVRLIPQNGASDISLVDRVRISYQHTFTADDDSLKLVATGGQQITIDGFTSRAIRVFDVTDSGNVQELVGEVSQSKSGFAVSVGPQYGAQRTLIAIADDRSQRSANVGANKPSSWRSSSNAADFVIITTDELSPAIEALKTVRQAEGYKVGVVDVEDIYDEFNFGNKSPQAIKDFLSYATTTWKLAPRFVLFAGDASFDGRNYLGLGDSDLVPTKLVDTNYMETASDDWFADFNNDGVSDLAVGRLPVRTIEEAAAVVAKLIGYSRSRPSESVALVSDANDGFNFEQSSAQLRALIPSSLKIEEIKRGELDPLTAKARLLDSITRGDKLVNYVGHGSANQWRGSLLTTADANALTNADRLPMFVMMTCLNGYFHDAALDSLAESLLKAERGGAIAVWASSGMTLPDQQAVINQQLYRLLFSLATSGKKPGAPTLGEATQRAKSAVADVDIRRTWILLGDPTMRLR